MKTQTQILTINDIDVFVETTYEWRTDYPDHPDGFWQETKREIIDMSPDDEDWDLIKKLVDKAKIDVL